jgi:hypothetical protein
MAGPPAIAIGATVLPVKGLIEPGSCDIVVRNKERELQALNIQRDAHDLVGAGLYRRRDLDIVTSPKLMARAAREIEPERLLPLAHII